ncbi:hypothetical protein [Agaribacter flavus]|uniref:Lipoprotein n=1 Tax=Agaribacter flavus TaxID=1902781 RepID=A0ABV7FS38_9ALTE
MPNGVKWKKHYLLVSSMLKHFAILLFVFGCLSACSSAPSEYVDISPTKHIEAQILVHKDIVLPPHLNESSGLHCTSNGLYTINDSGNAPVIYRLNKSGHVTEQTTVSAKNIDWESITSDSENFYIGDIGNNTGNRKDLHVLKVDRAGSAQKLNFQYAVQQNDSSSTNKQSSAMQHDKDAEAMVYKDGLLTIFSKSWRSHRAKMYELPIDGSTSKLAVKNVSEPLPFLITGADWDETTQHFVVVGYKVNTLSVVPYIALLQQDFTVSKIAKLKGYMQVEAVCADEGTYWFTQEKLAFSPAKLVNISLQ